MSELREAAQAVLNDYDIPLEGDELPSIDVRFINNLRAALAQPEAEDQPGELPHRNDGRRCVPRGRRRSHPRPRGEGEDMTDRKMLELAARAAGICLHPADKRHTSYGNWGSDTTCTICGKDPSAAMWNPLTDDGDALRLAVKLNLSFQSYPTWDRAQAWHPGMPEVAPEEPHGSDPYAATRRAIVRAAAEIGRQMEGPT